MQYFIYYSSVVVFFMAVPVLYFMLQHPKHTNYFLMFDVTLSDCQSVNFVYTLIKLFCKKMKNVLDFIFFFSYVITIHTIEIHFYTRTIMDG